MHKIMMYSLFSSENTIIYIPHSIVLPIKKVGFIPGLTVIFSLPESYKGKYGS